MLNFLFQTDKICRCVYKQINTNGNKFVKEIGNKWLNVIGKQLNETEVREKFEILYNTTVESRLQAFQSLIIQRAPVTNEKL